MFEEYSIKYNIFNEERQYHDVGLTTVISVPIKKGMKEKSNHDIAAKLFKKKHPTATIVTVSYC